MIVPPSDGLTYVQRSSDVMMRCVNTKAVPYRIIHDAQEQFLLMITICRILIPTWASPVTPLKRTCTMRTESNPKIRMRSFL